MHELEFNYIQVLILDPDDSQATPECTRHLFHDTPPTTTPPPEVHTVTDTVLPPTMPTIPFKDAVVTSVPGDGNCGFHALVYLLANLETGPIRPHAQLRRDAVDYLSKHQAQYQWKFPPDHKFHTCCDGDKTKYLAMMRTPCEDATDPQWMDELTLRACSGMLNRPICSWEKDVQKGVWRLYSTMPGTGSECKNPVHLAFSDKHYDAMTLRPAGVRLYEDARRELEPSSSSSSSSSLQTADRRELKSSSSFRS